MIKIIHYTDKYKSLWDEFVQKSKNGIFMFFRDYMDYHSYRFEDKSLLFFENNKLIALLPANRNQEDLVSHGGLTFGGIVADDGMTVAGMLKFSKR